MKNTKNMKNIRIIYTFSFMLIFYVFMTKFSYISVFNFNTSSIESFVDVIFISIIPFKPDFDNITPLKRYDDLSNPQTIKSIELDNKRSGIYGILNTKTGQIYVGSSVNIYLRLKEHLSGDKKRTNIKLSNSIAKYGLQNFSYIIFEYCDNSSLTTRETYFIQSMLPDLLFNFLLTAYSLLGYKHTDEAKAKISEVQIGKRVGENNPMFGKNHTDESKAKMSEAKIGNNNSMFGKTHSDEIKAKISAALSGNKSPWFGKNHTDETKAKLSEKAKNRGGQEIIVTDTLNNTKHVFNSQSTAAKFIGCSQPFISKTLINKSESLIKDRFKVETTTPKSD